MIRARIQSLVARAYLPKLGPDLVTALTSLNVHDFPARRNQKRNRRQSHRRARVVVNSTSLVGSSSKKSRVAFRSRIHRTHPSFRPPVRAFHRVVKSNKIFRIASLRTHRMATFRPRPRVRSTTRRVDAILRVGRREERASLGLSDHRV